MKIKITTPAIAFLMASIILPSCSMGIGDRRDRNIKRAVSARLGSARDVKYVGMSDVRAIDDNKTQAVVIYYVTDSTGNRIERNARIIANDDCSEIYSYENLDTQILSDAKQMVDDKLKENGLNIDGSLIDALIELKKR